MEIGDVQRLEIMIAVTMRVEMSGDNLAPSDNHRSREAQFAAMRASAAAL